MPVLILPIAVYFHKLLENCCLAAIAALRKLCRIMVVAVNVTVVLIIAVLRTKYCGTQGAGKMVDVVFAVQSCDVGTAQSSAALVT